MSRSFHSYAAIGMVVFTVVFEVSILSLFVDGFINGEIDSTFSVVTAIATVTMALCSAFNVIVVLKQSESMELQLVEMQTERKLRDKSLPWIDEITVFAKPPALSRNSEGKYGCHSNYYVDVTLRNLSQNPILSLDATLYLIFPLSWYTETTSEYVSVIPGLSQAMICSEFCCEETIGMYSPFAKSNGNYPYPQFQIKLTYKTFSEGCFTVTNQYVIFSPELDEEGDDLISWGKFISTVNLTCQEEMKAINDLLQKNKKDEALRIWNNVCEKNSIDNLRKESVRLRVRELPGSLEIKQILDDEYKQIVSDEKYSVYISDRLDSHVVRSTRFKKVL